MNLNQMKTIIQLSKLQSITQTADYFGVSQPAISKTLKDVESKRDIKIFDRLNKRLKLTSEGEILVKAFEKILEVNEQAHLDIQTLHLGKSEKISLVIHPILGKRIIPKLERGLENNSEVDLIYTFKTSREAMKDVLEGHSDFAIIADPLNYPELIVRNLWNEYIGLYSKDGKLKDKVFYNGNMIFLQKFLKEINFKMEKEVNDYGLIADILSENNSMGFLPNPIAEQTKNLKLIKKFGNPIKVALVYRYDRRKSKIFSKTAKLIKKVSQEV